MFKVESLGPRDDAYNVEAVGVVSQVGVLGFLARVCAARCVAEDDAGGSGALCAAEEDSVDGLRGHPAEVLSDDLCGDVLGLFATVQFDGRPQIGSEVMEEPQVIVVPAACPVEDARYFREPARLSMVSSRMVVNAPTVAKRRVLCAPIPAMTVLTSSLP